MSKNKIKIVDNGNIEVFCICGEHECKKDCEVCKILGFDAYT